jgi:hypothetical protein
VSFSLCKFISEWLLCKLYTSNYQPGVCIPLVVCQQLKGVHKISNLTSDFQLRSTFKPMYNDHPWDLKKGAVWKRLLIKFRFRLVVDDSNWSFITSGCYS